MIVPVLSCARTILETLAVSLGRDFNPKFILFQVKIKTHNFQWVANILTFLKVKLRTVNVIGIVSGRMGVLIFSINECNKFSTLLNQLKS